MPTFRAIFLFAIVASVAACSPPERDSRMRQIRSVCKAMGLPPSEAPFYACVSSLQRTAPLESTDLLANRGVRFVAPRDGDNGNHERIERACFDVGLAPRSPLYSECVGDLERTMFDVNLVGGSR